MSDSINEVEELKNIKDSIKLQELQEEVQELKKMLQQSEKLVEVDYSYYLTQMKDEMMKKQTEMEKKIEQLQEENMFFAKLIYMSTYNPFNENNGYSYKTEDAIKLSHDKIMDFLENKGIKKRWLPYYYRFFDVDIPSRIKAISEHKKTPLIQEAIKKYNEKYEQIQEKSTSFLSRFVNKDLPKNVYFHILDDITLQINCINEEYFLVWYNSFPLFHLPIYTEKILPNFRTQFGNNILPYDELAFPEYFFSIFYIPPNINFSYRPDEDTRGKEIKDKIKHEVMIALEEIYPIGSLLYAHTYDEYDNPSNYPYFPGKWILKETIQNELINIFQRIE